MTNAAIDAMARAHWDTERRPGDSTWDELAACPEGSIGARHVDRLRAKMRAAVRAVFTPDGQISDRYLIRDLDSDKWFLAKMQGETTSLAEAHRYTRVEAEQQVAEHGEGACLIILHESQAADALPSAKPSRASLESRVAALEAKMAVLCPDKSDDV